MSEQERIEYLRGLIREALELIDLGAPARAREVLIEALSK